MRGKLHMNNKAYLRLLILPILVTSPLLYASDNPNLRFFIDSANRSLRSRQFDRAINDLIPALRIAKREKASNETVSHPEQPGLFLPTGRTVWRRSHCVDGRNAWLGSWDGFP